MTQIEQGRQVLASIRYYQTLYGYADRDLWETAGVSERTWRTRERQPETFTVQELLRLAKRFDRTLQRFLIGEEETA